MKTNKKILSVAVLTEYFIFNPPSSTAPTKSKIAIAIMMPTTTGSFFVSETPMVSDATLSINRMAVAMQSDIEKIIIARGYTTAGTFSSIDEMTYSQKERASFILRPIINLDLIVQEGKEL